ncbi:ChbG/HpnK family deacetylase [Cellulomonas soli]
MSRLLVVTADDLGLTDGVCRAVHRAHVDGVVTATSLLAVGRAFDTAAAMLRDTPTLDLGAHLALVGEDPPLLSAREVPTLVVAGGGFPLSYRTVVARGLAGRIDPDDVRRELAAQLDRVLGLGLPVTHLDTHQHTHLWPVVAQVVAELAVARGVPVIRLPHSRRRGPVGVGVNLLAGRLHRRLDAAGIHSTDGYAGLDESLTMDLAAFDRALGAFGAGPGRSFEINLHPGERADPDVDRFPGRRTGRPSWSWRRTPGSPR